MAFHRKKQRGKRFRILIIILVIVAALAAAAAVFVVNRYAPSGEESDYESYYGLDEDGEMFIVVDTERSESNGFYIDGHAYVDYDTVHDAMNSRFYWDSEEQILRYALPDALLEISPEEAFYTSDKTETETDYTICTVLDGTMYLAMDFVAEYTDISYNYYEDPDRLVVSTEWGTIDYVKLKKSADVRQKGGVKSPILTTASRGDLVRVLEEGENWTKVCTDDGFIGYVMNRTLGKTQSVVSESTFEEPEYTHITYDEDLCIAWHQITNQDANENIDTVLTGLRGVNVISPTWFYLDDDEGNIASLASYDYVDYCHSKDIEVWGLVSNLENGDVDTEAVLTSTSSRDNLVNQVIAAAIQYDLDGINIDFESLSSDVGDGFIEFIRELSLKCANNGIVLSVDNYVPSEYTTLYQREEQANFADYVILMAYDEHYSGSEEAGSVASIEFVEQGVADTLAEGVPADQLILGIPFYTRVWAETPDESAESGYVLSSEAVSMSEAEELVDENEAETEWLEDCGQYYAEYVVDDVTYKIWLEEQNSIEEKLDVFEENGLAGVSFWKLGFEKSTIWDTVVEYVE